MTGETDLPTLLAGLDPELDEVTYVFATFPEIPDLSLEPIAMIQEDEGWTLIIRQDRACKHNLVVTFPCRRITLKVHSSLTAVGMMAAVARALADAGISCNPVAGYHHDHLFVPEKDSDRAVEVICQLSPDFSQGLLRASCPPPFGVATRVQIAPSDLVEIQSESGKAG